MNKIYNLKQDVFYPQSDSDDLNELKSMNKKTRRTNEALNAVIFLIGIAGFFIVFSKLDDGLYNADALKDSFRNGSSSNQNATIIYQGFEANESNINNNFQILGYHEAEETLNFEYNSYQPNNGVEYIINFGNGDSKKIKSKVTPYKYSRSGEYEITVKATFRNETKEVLSRKVIIDDAIFVQSDAFNESQD